MPPNKALQRTANAAFQLTVVQFWHQPRVLRSPAEALAAAERLIRWAALVAFPQAGSWQRLELFFFALGSGSLPSCIWFRS